MSGDPFFESRCPHCHGTGVVAPSTMGGRIRLLRLKAGLTQAELAAQTGSLISAKNLGGVEQDSNQNPPLAALRAIAKVFGVTVGYLLDGDELKDPLA